MFSYLWLAAIAVAYLIYRSFPKYIPGIPHLQAHRPFGDLPAFIKRIDEYGGDTGAIFRDRFEELDTPIYQLVIEPFGKPWVLVADSNTTDDILNHRAHEFDLSPLFSGLFRAIVPKSMLIFRSKDPRWKFHRRLMADTMSNKFFYTAAGPKVLAACSELVELWSEKIRLKDTFDAYQDLEDLLTDSSWATGFGESPELLRSHINMLAKIEQLTEYPTPPRSQGAKYIHALQSSSEIAVKSPFREWGHWFAIKTDPKLRKAMVYKDKFIGDRLLDAWKRFSTHQTEVKCASDLLVEKEVLLASKEQRPATYDSADVRDELYTFVLGMNDTTSTTMQWAVKFLTKHQDVQRKLRQEIGDQEYSPEEMLSSSFPYLDGFIMEVLRLGNTVTGVTRETLTDVEVLGHRIPKGTQMVFMINGPGYHAPPKTSVKNPFNASWDPKELHLFKPERWTVNHDGVDRFDARAGPQHNFSTGPRSCFGRRLALYALRCILISILQNFQFEPIPEELQDFKAYDILTHHPKHSHVKISRI